MNKTKDYTIEDPFISTSFNQIQITPDSELGELPPIIIEHEDENTSPEAAYIHTPNVKKKQKKHVTVITQQDVLNKQYNVLSQEEIKSS